MKWDIIDLDLPLRYFTTDCIRHFIFPDWIPYQNCGFPNYAIPITWYPSCWIAALFGHYGIKTLIVDFLIHIYFAGIGMYKLAKRFDYSDCTAKILGLNYLACGVFVANAQHFGWVIGTTWTPFLLAYYIDFARNFNKTLFCKLVLVLYLMITGSYPAILFLSCWLMLLLTIYFCIKQYQEAGFRRVTQYLFHLLLLIIATTIATLIVTIPTIRLMEVIARFNGIDKTRLLLNFQPIGGIISFVLPYAVVTKDYDLPKLIEFFGSSNSMMNMYFGIFTFIAFIIALFCRKKTLHKIFLYYGLICLMACYPQILPVREFLIDYVPTMNLFKIVSVYRIIFIIAAIICAGTIVEKIVKQEILPKKINLTLIAIIIVGIIFEIIALQHDTITWKHISKQIITQCLLIVAFIILYNQRKIKTTIWLPLLILTDMAIATQSNAAYTIYSETYNLNEISAQEKSFPRNYPLPTSNLINTNNHGLNYYWRNTSTFAKDFSFKGYNPYQIHDFNRLEENVKLFRNTLNNQLVFLSSTISPYNQISDSTLYSPKRLFIELQDYGKYTAEDSLNHCEITEISPNEIKINTFINTPCILTFLQNKYKGWHAYIDNLEVPILTSNYTVMSIEMPIGNHIVRFKFEDKLIYVLWIISIISVSICVYFVMKPKIKELRNLKKNLNQYRN